MCKNINKRKANIAVIFLEISYYFPPVKFFPVEDWNSYEDSVNLGFLELCKSDTDEEHLDFTAE